MKRFAWGVAFVLFLNGHEASVLVALIAHCLPEEDDT